MHTSRLLAVVVVFCVVGSSVPASAQLRHDGAGRPTGLCLAEGAVCLEGGRWVDTNGVVAVSGDVRLTIPAAGIGFTLGRAAFSVGTSVERMSLDLAARLGFEGAGPLDGWSASAGEAAFAIGYGADLVTRSGFPLGDTEIPKDPNTFYIYASVAGGLSVSAPVGVTVSGGPSIPGAQILVGIDPRHPERLVLYLGGGAFTVPISQGVVDDGYVLVALGEQRPPFTLSDFRNDFDSDATIARTLTPSYSVGGSVVLFTRTIPLALSGQLHFDVLRNRLRAAGGSASLAVSLEAYGIATSIALAETSFVVDPTACGGRGEYLVHAGRADASLFAGSGIEGFDVGTGGYTLDASVCGEDVIVQLRAATASIGGFRLGEVKVGFGADGVALAGKLDFAGARVDVVGSIDPATKRIRLRSTGGISLYGHSLADGEVELDVRGAVASVRVQGDLDFAGQRYHFDERVTSPSPTFSIPPVNVRARTTVDARIEGAGFTATMGLTGTGTLTLAPPTRGRGLGRITCRS
ncbi:MAG: hypothetical protein R3B99_13865, partial [Polyangiales bacterium]